MTTNTDALTEREKQTLRLLVRGHDAKSIACMLELSVHTINERLRDARRKLGVSSSRSAARLLIDAEEHDPEYLRDDHLGDAQPITAVPLPSLPPARVGMGTLATTVIGGLTIMTLLFTLALLAGSSGADTAQTTDPVAPAAAAQQSAAVDAAVRWLALADAQLWQESFDATAASFRSVNTVAGWRAAALSVQARLGELRSRALIDEQSVPTPPLGNHIVRFRASYANQAAVTETVALTFEDGGWKVAGIYVE
jgi:DNA-binding CsgD family transcriptional regulator